MESKYTRNAAAIVDSHVESIETMLNREYVYELRAQHMKRIEEE